MSEPIQEGFEVFANDGAMGFGAVRQVGKTKLVIYVENAGDYEVPMSAVADCHSGKVILDLSKLDETLLEAVRRAHASEDPRI